MTTSARSAGHFRGVAGISRTRDSTQVTRHGHASNVVKVSASDVTGDNESAAGGFAIFAAMPFDPAFDDGARRGDASCGRTTRYWRSAGNSARHGGTCGRAAGTGKLRPETVPASDPRVRGNGRRAGRRRPAVPCRRGSPDRREPVSYTHLRAHETRHEL